ncbi:microfibril-associated glycoprotein 4-like [Branchiostoma floridae x Branchiostoma japonicum]
MWFLHVFVVLAVLQWSVVKGEDRTDQFSLALCGVWEECVRTASDVNPAHTDLGTPQAICGDFLEMLVKHDVDCEETADVVKTPDPVSLEPHQDNEDQEYLSTTGIQEEADDGKLSNKRHLPDNVDNQDGTKNVERTYFDDCSEVYTAQALFATVTDGPFSIKPFNVDNPISVYCDQTTDGGGWTVIQRRFDGSLQFYRQIEAYRDGFGDSSGEYWLGLENIYRILAQNAYELYIELEDWEGIVTYAKYSSFSIDQHYTLHVTGYSGTAGDGFGTNYNLIEDGFNLNYAWFRARSSACDCNHNIHFTSRLGYFGDGWWCHSLASHPISNLNGPYFRDTDGHNVTNGPGVYWPTFEHGHNRYYSLKKTKMMIRPTDLITRMANNKIV